MEWWRTLLGNKYNNIFYWNDRGFIFHCRDMNGVTWWCTSALYNTSASDRASCALCGIANFSANTATEWRTPCPHMLRRMAHESTDLQSSWLNSAVLPVSFNTWRNTGKSQASPLCATMTWQGLAFMVFINSFTVICKLTVKSSYLCLNSLIGLCPIVSNPIRWHT